MPHSRTMTPAAAAPVLAAKPHRRWATATLAGSPDTSPGDLSALGDHAELCRDARGRWFRARCMAESVYGFLAPRFVTTLVVVGIVLGVGSLVA